MAVIGNGQIATNTPSGLKSLAPLNPVGLLEQE